MIPSSLQEVALSFPPHCLIGWIFSAIESNCQWAEKKTDEKADILTRFSFRRAAFHCPLDIFLNFSFLSPLFFFHFATLQVCLNWADFAHKKTPTGTIRELKITIQIMILSFKILKLFFSLSVNVQPSHQHQTRRIFNFFFLLPLFSF